MSVWGVVLLVAAATDGPGWTPADTQRVVGIADVQVSPDGRRVAFVAERADLVRNRVGSTLSMVLASGGSVRTLSGPEDTDASPRWSPDGTRLAFLSETAGGMGLYVMSADGGGRRRLCAVVSSNEHIPEIGDPFAWSPDGRFLVFAGAEPAQPPQGRDPLVITRLIYRSAKDYVDDRLTQLWIVPAEGGTPRRLSDGRHVDHSPAWSPDGREIVFVSNREGDPDARHNNDLWVADVASGRLRRLTQTPGSEYQPAWSPDGRHIAYRATTRAWTSTDSVAEDFHAFAIPAQGGAARDLFSSLDRRAAAIAWSPDSAAVIATADDRGRMRPYRVELLGGRATPMFDADAWVGEPSVARDGSLAFWISRPTQAPEVARLAPGEADPRSLTALNAGLGPSLGLVDAEGFWFDGAGGQTVQAWLMRPPGYASGTKAPLLLAIHGGPHGAYGFRFSAEFQMYAAAGYFVLFANPRGSSGYGQRFSDGTLLSWGGGDFEDLMRGVDHVLAAHPDVDADRLLVTGTSYGGYMTNWIVTRTDRFRAAVTREGISNLMTDPVVSLYWNLEHVEFGPAAESQDVLLRFSPIRHIRHARTPTLVIQGAADNEVGMAEADQMYQGLKLQGVPTELVIYPREGHEFEEPRHRVDAYERMLRWFERHLRGDRRMDQAWRAAVSSPR